jgi:hypothetical protein
LPASARFAVFTGTTNGDGLLVEDKTVYQYDGGPQGGLTLPLKATQSSQINAEFVDRGQRKLELAGRHVGREQILTNDMEAHGESDCRVERTLLPEGSCSLLRERQ